MYRQRMILSEVFMLQYGDTALHWTARRGKVEAVKVLVDYGVAVDIRNEVQWYNIYCTYRTHAYQR